MPPRDLRALAQEHHEKARASASTSDSPPIPHATFDFLGLSAELRNMVYDVLWKDINRISIYYARSGVIAYYDGTVVDETELTTEAAIRHRDKNRTWPPENGSGLPRWLLANKKMHGEALEQFRLEAHWNM
ncbi:hypothetical protein CC86DRAFT_382963 [Ophiobolus disseminans]|uniref:Uncharacterized protein n=1 Tax=Ophiobolus disseminans TaxID=1469910 RepID=A0A6A6ZZR6_9PLEO|nr:hypothetical protein CC86DRAFT_382963 [Ophiobolus disseminans]